MTNPASLVTLTAADHDEILAVLQNDGGYAVRVNGQPAEPHDVTELLTEKPPQVPTENHHVIGLRVDADLAGVASLVVGWPEPDITFLGLLQLRADHQGKGLARYFHQALRDTFPGRWRLTVVDTNAQVIPIWERLGYLPTGRRTDWMSPSGLHHETVEMEAPAQPSRPV